MKERRIIAELLKLYREFPCLWNNTNKLYNNKEARLQAIKVLLEKYKLLDDEATIETVKNKIENMRCCYKREYKRVLAARINDDEEYRPTLWYYKLLTFLDDGEYSYSESFRRDRSIVSQEDEEYQTIDFQEEELSPPASKKAKMSTMYLEEQRDSLETPNNEYLLTDNNADVVSGEAEAFGRTVGFQISELTSMQRTIAEKLISDIIFYGRLNKLSTETMLVLNDDN